jgi:hypothetical protein
LSHVNGRSVGSGAAPRAPVVLWWHPALRRPWPSTPSRPALGRDGGRRRRTLTHPDGATSEFARQRAVPVIFTGRSGTPAALRTCATLRVLAGVRT